MCVPRSFVAAGICVEALWFVGPTRKGHQNQPSLFVLDISQHRNSHFCFKQETTVTSLVKEVRTRMMVQDVHDFSSEGNWMTWHKFIHMMMMWNSKAACCFGDA